MIKVIKLVNLSPCKKKEQPYKTNIMKLRSILCGVLAIAAAVACKPDDVVETPKLDVDKAAVSVTAEAGQATFNVTTNQDWTASADADWVSVNPNNGKASDKAVAVKVTAEDNATEAERTATVTVKAGTLSKTVKVTQAAKAAEPTPEPEPEPEPELKLSDWAIVGSFTGEGWGWDPAAGIPLYILNDEYFVVYGLEIPTDAQFKFLQGGAWGGAEVGADRTSVEPNTIQAKGGTNIYLPVGGTYDIYLSADATKYYIMSVGKTPAEATEPAPAEVTYTVTGTLQGQNWNNMAAEGLMAKEGNYYVAKNVPFVTAATLYGGADQIEFKICNTGSWDGAYGAAVEAVYGANAEIAVVVNGGNIAVSAPEGAYDVYFDKENGKTWVMTPGYKPGDEVPGQGGEEPADYDIDGKQWCFTWNALGGAPCVIDFGVTQPGTAVLAYDMGAIDPSYAGIYFPYMFGEYTITKTDGTSGVVALTSEGMTIEIPYSNATENSVHFATAALLEEDVDCTLATSPITIYMESAQGLADGEYWIIADGKVATPLTGNYGYLNVVDAVDGRSTAANAFTFTQVDAGLYTIQDANGKFYYQTGSYNSFNVADEDGMTDEFLWEVYDTGNGQYAIINYEVGKYIQYDTQYNSYGSYMDERGILPTLVLAENPITEPEPTPGETLAHPFTSNIEWTLGTKAYSEKATINGNSDISVLKLGTGSLTGDATVVIPAGATKVGFYGVAWKGKTGTLTASSELAGGKFFEQTFVSNDGAANQSPYTMTVSDETDYYEIDVVALLGTPCPMDLPVTLSTAENAYRVIIFGLNYYTE